MIKINKLAKQSCLANSFALFCLDNAIGRVVRNRIARDHASQSYEECEPEMEAHLQKYKEHLRHGGAFMNALRKECKNSYHRYRLHRILQAVPVPAEESRSWYTGQIEKTYGHVEWILYYTLWNIVSIKDGSVCYRF